MEECFQKIKKNSNGGVLDRSNLAIKGMNLERIHDLCMKETEEDD